jgi:nicotinate-nucleotide adenylyltransferase
MKNKVGLYFGSFDPVHIGHLMIAAYIRVYLDIDEIWFVVSPQNPLKTEIQLTDETHRLKMIELAIEDEPGFKFSDIEFDLPKPSYTIDTLNYLTSLYHNNVFSLIIGSDNLSLFHKWKKADEIIEQFRIIVYPRNSKREHEHIVLHPNIVTIDAPFIDISSTEIRNYAMEKKQLLTQFLSYKVANYIKEQGLYGL